MDCSFKLLMNGPNEINVLQIIREGNKNLARVWLQSSFLVADIPDDVLLVECTLTKIEISGGVKCESGREALNWVYLILDEISLDQPEKASLLDRWLTLDHQFRCFES
ncbi:MAG TPA: hypothetical protein PJ988_02430 [Anaerolinea sp.]|nr:hypothetical protein [Anaerolinea sp.]